MIKEQKKALDIFQEMCSRTSKKEKTDFVTEYWELYNQINRKIEDRGEYIGAEGVLIAMVRSLLMLALLPTSDTSLLNVFAEYPKEELELYISKKEAKIYASSISSFFPLFSPAEKKEVGGYYVIKEKERSNLLFFAEKIAYDGKIIYDRNRKD